jgi:hypothetical protein
MDASLPTMTGVNRKVYEQYDHNDWERVRWLDGVCESKIEIDSISCSVAAVG